jgi:streptogramin lyase
MKRKMLLLMIPGLALILLAPLVGCTPTQTPTTPIPPPATPFSTPTSTPSQTQTPTPSSGVISPSGNWTTFTTEDGLASNIVTGITQDEQGIIWVASTEGLTRFDSKDLEIYNGTMRNTHVVCTARDKQGNLWFGTSFGLVRYNPG